MMKIIKEWKWVIIASPFVLLFGFLIRIYNLTILPVFADEAIYIRWSQIMSSEPTLRFLPLSDGKQPLFMWILMFGVRRLSDPLFAGRLVSVMAGMGSIIGVGALAYILFKSKKASVTASLIYSVSPYSVFFDRMALVDALLSMLTIWTFIFAVIAAKTKRIDAAMVCGFFLGAASLTKSPALFVGLLIPTAWILSDWKKKKFINLFQLGSLLLITYFIAFGMYNILRLGPNFHLLSSRTKDYVYPVSHLWENPLDPLRPYFDRSLRWIFAMGTGWIFLLILASLKNTKRYWKEYLFLTVWFLVPILIQSEFAKVITARYIYFSIPALFIFAGMAIEQEREFIKRIFYLIFAIFILSAARFDYLLLTKPEIAPLPRGERSGYLEEWTAGTGIREVADYLKEEQSKNPDQNVVVGTEGYFGTLPDGLQMYIDGTPNVTVIGIGLGINQVPEPLTESKQAGNKTYLVANSSRLLFDKDLSEYGLKVVKEYKKANRAPMTREIVQHGEYDTFYLLELID